MSFISASARHHRNYNLLLSEETSSGPVVHTVTYAFNNASSAVEIFTDNALLLFNPTLGTLVGASITVTNAFNADLTLTTGVGFGSPHNIKGTADCYMSFDSYDNTALSDIIFNFGANNTLSSVNTGLFLGTIGNVYPFPNLNTAASTTYDLNAILADMSGVGSFHVTAETITGAGTAGGAGVSLTTNMRAASSASITYTYTVP